MSALVLHYWNYVGNWSAWRKLRLKQGEHANFTQKDPSRSPS